ncbi:minor tail protein [Nitrosomonas oligotropha]|uniref:Minor tail protein n=1 Tax=Nitrosomonas oligotropha TaxID=42354 RepID=A0A2T5HH10_9PROT|nr:phage tail tape measure protein [Nitrosomonas oligotropha]PTQ70858.1 minor tail protein [Nitrosomonas oligotropha]
MAFGNNISLGMIIGGAVGASFASAINSASSKIDVFKKKAEKARGFQSMVGDTIRLREELIKAAGTDAFAKLKEKHDRNINVLKQHGIGVKDLKREYEQLGKTVKGLELGAAGRIKVGEGIENIKESGRAIAGVVGATVIPTMAAANYEAIIRDIAIKGGIARTGKETELGQGIRKDAQSTGMDRNELAQAVNTLVAGGMEVPLAASLAKTIARFSISQNAQSEDVAKMILALRQSGITDPALMEKTLGKVAVAGDLGSFESKDMAKHFASLMPQMTMFGFSGERGTAELANMLQTQMKAAGSTDEAANNLANLFSKITSEDTRSKFEKKGFSLQNSMELAISQGLDPVTAFLKLVQKMSSQSDPAKAAQMADLQKQIADAQDPAAAQKMLDGYLEMAGLSEFISDRQAKQAALAVLQNQKLHESNLKLIQAADGEAKIEKDLADRRAASAKKWREVGYAFDEAMVSIGDALRPITDTVATGLINIGKTISSLASQFPGVTQGILAIASAFAIFKSMLGIFKIGSGIFNILRGGLMAAGAAKIGGALSLAGAGGAAASGGTTLAGSAAFPLLGALTGGYAIGTGISSLIDKGLSKMTGENTTLGGWLYDKMHPEQAAASKAMTEPAPQNNTFSPSIQVTVQGDAKDPNLMANEIMRHLERVFEQKQARSANGAMFDAAYAQ